MMNMRINKQPMYYSKYSHSDDIYALDENGDVIYDLIDGELVPRLIGEYQDGYNKPTLFYGNITSGTVGEAKANAYGFTLGEYEAVLCIKKGELPLDEGTLIWYQTEPKMLDDNTVDQKSADYRVKRVPPCLNECIYLLGRLDNNGNEETGS